MDILRASPRNVLSKSRELSAVCQRGRTIASRNLDETAVMSTDVTMASQQHR